MHALRNKLDLMDLVKGLKTEEKDPEELINLLLVHVFRTKALISLR